MKSCFILTFYIFRKGKKSLFDKKQTVLREFT